VVGLYQGTALSRAAKLVDGQGFSRCAFPSSMARLKPCPDSRLSFSRRTGYHRRQTRNADEYGCPYRPDLRRRAVRTVV